MYTLAEFTNLLILYIFEFLPAPSFFLYYETKSNKF
jgi:hypothetical protein